MAAPHYFPLRANGQIVPILPSALIRSTMTAIWWLYWRLNKESEDAQRREFGLPKATASSARRIVERGSLEIHTYDELVFPGPAAEWGGRRPFVGALTTELPTDANNKVASWIAAETPPIYFCFGSKPVESVVHHGGAGTHTIWELRSKRLKVATARRVEPSRCNPPMVNATSAP